MANGTILIIDDEEKLRELMAQIIRMEGYAILEAKNLKAGMKKLEQNPVNIVICDVRLPDGNGVDFTAEIKMKFPNVEVIVLTAYGNIPDGVKAIKNGAFDYLTKGDDNDRLIPLVNQAMNKVKMRNTITQLEKQGKNKLSFDDIIFRSNIMNEVVQLAKKVAPTTTNVLLLGETGTGKEVFAQAIHGASLVHSMPFVAVNCSAISKELMESELFGHKAGAFTGAIKDTKGLFEEADHGTIFLDEIGEMNLDLQAKLLRVLESGEFIKVGDTKPHKVNVRIIAATNRDLRQEAEEGKFRADLYYRLSTFQILLPSLNERTEDIPLLATEFVHFYCEKMNKTTLKISPEYLEKLKSHFWKGNIRELKNIIERSVILSDTEVLELNSLPFDLRYTSTYTSNKNELASVEKSHILKVLERCNGNKTKAAELLDIGIATLYRKLNEYGIM